MENASKALLMAASVLIATMVISIGVYIFNIFGTFAKNRQEELYTHQLAQFNAQFTKYETTEDTTIHDIISLANYARNYNDTNGITDDSVDIKVIIFGEGEIQNKTTEQKNELITDSLEEYELTRKVTNYKVNAIEYNQATGRVNKIIFKKIT